MPYYYSGKIVVTYTVAICAKNLPTENWQEHYIMNSIFLAKEVQTGKQK